MNGGQNLALVATRQVTRPQFEHVLVSQHIIEIKACSHDRNTQIFPLYIREAHDELALSAGATPNLNSKILAKLAEALGLRLNASTSALETGDELSPLQVFHFACAILHCPSYRDRYFEFLRSDFPRLPLPGHLPLFRELSRLGGELTALHLLDSPTLQVPTTEFIGDNRQVTKLGWTPDDGGTVWLDGKGSKNHFKPGTSGFRPVPEEIWNFRIGGYQVCEKWLKDRQAKGGKNPKPGRTLTDDDIAHYQKIVIALTETIRLMAEIDEVIEAHGGWPDAFQTKPTSE